MIQPWLGMSKVSRLETHVSGEGKAERRRVPQRVGGRELMAVKCAGAEAHANEGLVSRH